MSTAGKPKYTIVGFTLIAAVAAAVAALVYLGGFAGNGSNLLVETYYDRPVNGLSPGSPVNFRGLKIGEVKYIKIAGPRAGDISTVDAQRIRILMSIDLRKIDIRNRPSDEHVKRVIEEFVNRGLRATVSSSGITGLSRIELNIVENAAPPGRISWNPRHPLIPPSPSLLESFSDAATKLMNQLNKMDFMSLWSNVSTVATSAARLTSNADALVESQRSAVAGIVGDIEETAAAMRELIRTLNDNPSLLLRPNDPQPLPETSGR